MGSPDCRPLLQLQFLLQRTMHSGQTKVKMSAELLDSDCRILTDSFLEILEHLPCQLGQMPSRFGCSEVSSASQNVLHPSVDCCQTEGMDPVCTSQPVENFTMLQSMSNKKSDLHSLTLPGVVHCSRTHT